jgi:TetR/AcrR family transcriptional repressor of nem operon
MKFIPRSEATRQAIIESTAELFNKRGFAATSVTDLEKATGLTKGSIYGNFENKEAVALAVFDYNLQLKVDYMQKEQDKCSTYKAKVLSHILVHYPSAKAPFTPGGCPMQNTAIQCADINTELTKRAADGLLTWTKEITSLIQAGIVAEEFKKETDSTGVALEIISLIEGAALFARSTGSMKISRKLLDRAQQRVTQICT